MLRVLEDEVRVFGDLLALLRVVLRVVEREVVDFDFVAPVRDFVDRVVEREVVDFEVDRLVVDDFFVVPVRDFVERVVLFPVPLDDELVRDLVERVVVFFVPVLFAVDFVAISVAPVATVWAPKILAATQSSTRMTEAT